MRLPIAFAVTLIVSSCCHVTNAGILTNHAGTLIYGEGSGTPSTYYGSTLLGNTASSQADSGFGTGNGLQTAESWATMNLNPGQYKQGTKSYSSGDRSGSSVPDGTAYSAAGWQDIVFIDHLASAGEFITLNFSVDGFLDVTNGGGFSSKSQSRLLVRAFGQNELDSIRPFDTWLRLDGIDIGQSHIAGLRVNPNIDPPIFSASGQSFSSFSWDPTSGFFEGDIEFRSSYKDTYGGFGFTAVMATLTEAEGGTALADFSNSLTFTGITDSNGNLLNSSDYSFDSGFKPSGSTGVVPEPTSLAIFGVGALGMIGFGRRRKKLKSR